MTPLSSTPPLVGGERVGHVTVTTAKQHSRLYNQSCLIELTFSAKWLRHGPQSVLLARSLDVSLELKALVAGVLGNGAHCVA